MCKYSNGVGTVEHYFNKAKLIPTLLVNENPTIGISNAAVSTNQGFLVCSFSREKSNPSIENYFDLNLDYYLMLAKGILNGI
jgi:hypothetical protein